METVDDIVKEESLEMKEKYGDERKTKIVAAADEFEDEDLENPEIKIVGKLIELIERKMGE